MINVTIGLQVGITCRLAVRVYKDKGLQRLHTRSPSRPVWLVWCPCIELLWCVVRGSQLMDGAVKYVPQRCFISGLVTAYMHGLAGASSLVKMNSNKGLGYAVRMF